MPIGNLTPCEAPRKIPVTFVQLAALVPTAPPPATLVPKTPPPATLDPVAPQPATQDPTAPQPATLVPAVPPPDTLASATPQLATLVPTARSPATLVPRALQTATRGCVMRFCFKFVVFLLMRWWIVHLHLNLTSHFKADFDFACTTCFGHCYLTIVTQLLQLLFDNCYSIVTYSIVTRLVYLRHSCLICLSETRSHSLLV